MTPPRFTCALLLGAAIAAPSLADSFASSASSAGSASLGSSSDSIEGSSDSSSPDRQAREGTYRVIDVAEAAAGEAARVRLTLQAEDRAGPDGRLTLRVPREALGDPGLAAGDRVNVRQRPYGLEFARAATREPFFLVLDDAWHRELAPKAVKL